MAQAQKPDFVFRRKGRVNLNRRVRQFSRLLAAEVCASAVVMLDTPCFEVVWRVLASHSIRQFPLRFPSRASPCAITFQLDSSFNKPPHPPRFIRLTDEAENVLLNKPRNQEEANMHKCNKYCNICDFVHNKQRNTIFCIRPLDNSPNKAFFTFWMRYEQSNKRLDKCLNIISMCFLCSSIIGLVTNTFLSSNWKKVQQRALHSTHIGNRTDIPSNGSQARGRKTYCT